MQVGNYQNTNYIVPVQSNVSNQQYSNISDPLASYPYGQDVFSGQYASFKTMYSNFDTSVSRFSPFYGKMGNQNNSSFNNIPSNNNNQVITQTNTNNIPANTMSNNPVINTQNTIPAVIPKKITPKGPALTNIQELLQNEVKQISTPQKAIETIAQHAMISRQERTMANNISWGARFYAKKALELAQELERNRVNMNQSQINSLIMNIENLKIKSISLLNEAKKRAINTYNEALKATLLYNHFFTENGQYTTILNDNDRKFVEDELDKTWKHWEGGFQKEWQGSIVKADEAPLVIDKSAQEIYNYINSIDNILAKLKN
ncbi:MAG: hypothetical protein KatS3mg068_1671 [Candidatus Sericytochromatia bacterium]|nr:MAG: hypothetical protein KatS3mg068_1671 [Candidatus Sericytochromatia bacterium]